MTEGKLVFVPKGYRVVPEEPTAAMFNALWGAVEEDTRDSPVDPWEAAIKAAPSIGTPPVLRWEGDVLMVLEHPLAYINHLSSGGVVWHLNTPTPQHMGNAMDSILARRAAEKALGFPEWLVVEQTD